MVQRSQSVRVSYPEKICARDSNQANVSHSFAQCTLMGLKTSRMYMKIKGHL
jgi:hypothetical protein